MLLIDRHEVLDGDYMRQIAAAPIDDCDRQADIPLDLSHDSDCEADRPSANADRLQELRRVLNAIADLDFANHACFLPLMNGPYGQSTFSTLIGAPFLTMQKAISQMQIGQVTFRRSVLHLRASRSMKIPLS
jgi:hypothetical protein